MLQLRSLYQTVACITLLAVVFCGEKMDPILGPVDAAGAGAVTYTVDIQPILVQNCTSCHSTELSGNGRNGAPSGINFNAYEMTIASAQQANARIQAGSMPPNGGIPLNQRNLFQSWIESGLER